MRGDSGAALKDRKRERGRAERHQNCSPQRSSAHRSMFLVHTQTIDKRSQPINPLGLSSEGEVTPPPATKIPSAHDLWAGAVQLKRRGLVFHSCLFVCLQQFVVALICFSHSGSAKALSRLLWDLCTPLQSQIN